ncbi:MAG TPA: hypothetical protein VGX76_01645 [Pirellulales bacterium]|jgi:hypothetical protein|nr:hypothetical protein [Pirellulales bacterium]
MPSLNFLSDDMRRDPFPISDHLRATCPVRFDVGAPLSLAE